MKLPDSILGLAAAVVVAAAGASASLAQSKAPFMEALPFTYEGQIGGLDAWSLPEQDDLWLVLPDGNTVIAGFVFNGRGIDIGSAMLGIEPINVFESLHGANSLDASAEEPAEIASEGSHDAMPAALQDTLMIAAPRMAASSDQDRDALLAELVTSLQEATSPEEFQRALLEWRQRVMGEEVIPQPASAQGDITPARGAAAASEMIEATLAGLQPPAEEAQGVAAHASVALYEDLANETFWLPLGNTGSAPIYMVYDPACPYCARSIRNLENRIRNGDIHLRLILAPAVSPQSLPLVAAILAADDPVEALIGNAIHLANSGQHLISPQDPAALGPEILHGIQANIAVMMQHEVPAVPFFAWQGGAGPRFLAGVPEANYEFSGR